MRPAFSGELDCRDGQFGKLPDVRQCYCDSDLCNAGTTGQMVGNVAMTTSSVGHVITVVALLITIITGHLL